MTRTNTQRSLIAASAFGAVTAIIMFAQAGQASAATSVLSCEGSNRGAVLQCCETRVKKNGLPLWMRQAGANCHSPAMVRCYGTFSANSKRCKIALIHADDKGDKDKGGRKRR